MTDLERLKQAEEDEPMAVLITEIPKECLVCKYRNAEYCVAESAAIMAFIKDIYTRPDWCPLRPAIGIIEPGGHVAYLREDGEE